MSSFSIDVSDVGPLAKRARSLDSKTACRSSLAEVPTDVGEEWSLSCSTSTNSTWSSASHGGASWFPCPAASSASIDGPSWFPTAFPAAARAAPLSAAGDDASWFPIAFPAAQAVVRPTPGPPDWQSVLGPARDAIVMLQVTVPSHFQWEEPASSVSSGFVVDATRGLILTNLHNIGHGPFRATARFAGSEEVRCVHVYSDPTHDFAFLRFDPAELWLTQRAELQLCPEELNRGVEVCVLGNDDGEQWQVLPCTVARLDRDIPEVDSGFSDENTFYVGAGSSTSCGSSGSPVLNGAGHCVALNTAVSGGRAGGYFLPLERVARCLELLQNGEVVSRGTICVRFVFKSVEDVRRLGPPPAAEGESRGRLVVSSMLQGSEAIGRLRAGDVLLAAGGRACFDFSSLEAYLDTNVGMKVRLRICRAGVVREVEVHVQNLRSLVPSQILELEGAAFHDVGYQVASHHNLRLNEPGVFASEAAFLLSQDADQDGAKRSMLVRHVGGVPTPDVVALQAALLSIPAGETFLFSYLDLGEPALRRAPHEALARMPASWADVRLWKSECGPQGIRWRPSRLPGPTLAEIPVRRRVSGKRPRTTPVPPDAKRAPLALVRFRPSVSFAVTKSASRVGVALVLDATAGLCVTDRVTVPELLGDVELQFGEAPAPVVPACVVFLHPRQNLALLRFDPARLPFPMHSAKLADQPNGPRDASKVGGDGLVFAGLNAQGQYLSADAVEERATFNFSRESVLQWGSRSREVLRLAEPPPGASGGVCCDAQGNVRSIHMPFPQRSGHEEDNAAALFGLPASVLSQLQASLAMCRVRSGSGPQMVCVPSLPLEFEPLQRKLSCVTSARLVPAEWRKSLRDAATKAGLKEPLLQVVSTAPEQGVNIGDVLLAVDGVSAIGPEILERALDMAVRAADPAELTRDASAPAALNLTLCRQGGVIEIPVPISFAGSDGASRVLLWAGCVLVEATPEWAALRRSVGIEEPGVFCVDVLSGSPAEAAGLSTAGGGCFLRAVADAPLRTLDDFLRTSREHCSDGLGSLRGSGQQFLRLETVDLQGWEAITPIRLDPEFWPTVELRQGQDGFPMRVEHR